jgi:hypothetical protein
MGNWISRQLKRPLEGFANWRRSGDANNRSRPDHPELLPANKLAKIEYIEQKSEPLSVPTPTTTVVTTSVEAKATREPLITLTTTESLITITSQEATEITKTKDTISSLIITCSDFYLACRNNQIDEVQELLKTISLDEIDRVEPNGSTALHAASYHGHIQIVRLLLEAGADRAIRNKFNFLPFDEAAHDGIKELFYRIPTSSRLVSDTGAIEWQLIDDDILEKAEEERHIIRNLYDRVPITKMFERIEKNYIGKGLTHFNGIENIRRFFEKATNEQDPIWIIKAYTAETDLYKALNKEIAGGANNYQSERRYIIALISHHPALDQLTYIGASYRVMQVNDDEREKYQVNCSLMTKSFLSSSIDEKLAAWFLCRQELARESGDQRQRARANERSIKSWIMCVYNIKHRRTALHIENSSQYAVEGEILIMPYTVFEVKQIKQVKFPYLSDEHLITQIELEECEQYLNMQK